MSLKRTYHLNLPQLLWGGLSENWLLKELGNVHWQQITDALGLPSKSIVNQEGKRLYASFTRVSWSGTSLSSFEKTNR